MNVPTRRLFDGMLADDKVSGAIAHQQHRSHWGAGRPAHPATGLHLTLHFHGEIDAPREHALRNALIGQRRRPVRVAGPPAPYEVLDRYGAI